MNVRATSAPAGRRTRRQFTLYVAIGALSVTIDLSLFRVCIGAHFVAEVAAIAGGAGSMAVHFLLNKYVNFKNHDRPLRDQVGTYCAVVSVWWVVTLTVVAVLTRLFGLSPVLAKLIAVAVNFPFGFFAQRNLTFGAGIAAGIRRWRSGKRRRACPP